MNATKDTMNQTLAKLQTAAGKAEAVYDWEQAIEHYNQALELTDLSPEFAYELRSGRAAAYNQLGNAQAEASDLETLALLAEEMADATRRIDVLIRQAQLLTFQRELDQARQLAETAIAEAKQIEDFKLEARGHLALGRILYAYGDFDLVRENYKTAQSLFQKAVDPATESEVYFRLGWLAAETGQPDLAVDYFETARSIGRQAGYRPGEALGLNGLAHISEDVAKKFTYVKQALAIFEEINSIRGQTSSLNNIAVTYGRLGLYSLARRYANRLFQTIRAQKRPAFVNGLETLGRIYLEMGLLDLAQETFEEGYQEAADSRPAMLPDFELAFGQIALAQEQSQEAQDWLLSSAARFAELGQPADQAAALAWAGAAALALDEMEAAQEHTAKAVALFEQTGGGSPDYRPQEIWWWRYRAIAPHPLAPFRGIRPSPQPGEGEQVAGGEEDAFTALDQARELMLAEIASLSDEGLRRNYLNKILTNRDIVTAWLQEAAARDISLAPLLERTTAAPSLPEQFRRLVDIGNQLTAERDPETLPHFILEVFVELSGVERAFLRLLDNRGEGTTTWAPAAYLTQEEMEEAQRTVEPLLAEVQTTRQPLLLEAEGQVPEGAVAALYQCSVLVLPLLSRGKLWGVLYGDMRRAFGRFRQEDLDLAHLLANQAAAALENANWSRSLEQKVEQRTAELQLANERLERQNNELAVINTVQEGLVAELDIQAIYDLVGDQIREIFDAQAVIIDSLDLKKQLINFHYWVEKDQRFELEPLPFTDVTHHLIKTGRPLLINRLDDPITEELQLIPPAGDVSKSMVFVPLIVDKEVRGRLSLQNIDQEDAFSETDVRLLTTLANSLSVALESARLFDETNRLLAETEQRNSELAVINAIQEGLVAELDMQAIYDLVGDKVGEIFTADTTFISLYDSDTQLLESVYYNEHGHRHKFDPTPLGHNLMTRVIELRKPLYWGTSDEWKVFTEAEVPSPDSAEDLNESVLAVPISLAEQVMGIISVQSYQQHAYDKNDIRLLTTLANSMSVALENARLFAETNRLLNVTEQRNSELAVINAVQEGLAAELDMRAIYDLVGNTIREIFDAQVVVIRTYDHVKQLVVPHYLFEKGEQIEDIFRNFNDLDRHLIRTRQAVNILENPEEAIAQFGLTITPGTGIPKSSVWVPLVVGETAIGHVSLQNIDREHAFDEADIRLLNTLANSMSVALENARLFNETQRLLEETEQRVNELSTINHISQALAAELELDRLIQLVGEQTRQTFKADITYVALLDQQSNMIHFPYEYGDNMVSIPFGQGLTSRIIETSQPLLINEEIEQRHTELETRRIGVMAKSYLGVPITFGRETIGVLSVQSKTEEGRFGDDDVRLLSTIAANVGVAVQNARLYQETQRAAEEMAALATVSRHISATLDLDTVLTQITDHALELLDAQDSAVYLPDDSGQVYQAVVAVGPISEHIKASPVIPGQGIIGDVILSGTAEYVNDAESDPRTLFIPGTDELPDNKLMVAPLLVGERVSGMMAVWRAEPGNNFDDDDLRFLRGLARQAAIAIENARLYTEVETSRAEAEAANKAKSTFLANMSHELRTPLNAIIGFTRIVKRKAQGNLSDKQIDNLDKVLVSAEHLLGLINTILDIAKIEAGRMDVQATTFDLNNLIDLCMVTTQPLVKSGVELVKEVAAGLPPVYSDQDKVKQILLNLLSNAAKFTSEGQITIQAHADEHDRLVVSVSDTGIGISDADLERIFEEFQQGDSSSTRQYGGTGLGLSISRQLTRLLEGHLSATSVEGQGSTFTFTIPFIYGQGERLRLTDQIKTEPQEKESVSQQYTVLTIDDNPDVIYLLRENLREAGYQVVGATNGIEGLQKARELKPFAITLDIMMPQKDGWQVLHDLKNDPGTRDIPVILLTVVDKKAMGYELGASDYLVKPLDEEAVLAALKHLSEAKGDSPPTHLLIVDDDPTVADMVEQMLSEGSYQVNTAADGLAALDSLKHQIPDAILLDLLMPRLDGFETLAQLRQDEQYRDIPVIVLTAKSLTANDMEILQDSACQIIQKQGLEAEVLVAKLQKALNSQSKESSA